MNWKIIIPFILSQIVSNVIFSLIITIIVDSFQLNNLVLFIGIFIGILGFKLLFTVILRSKRIRIKNKYFTYSKFKIEKKSFLIDNIASYRHETFQDNFGVISNSC